MKKSDVITDEDIVKIRQAFLKWDGWGRKSKHSSDTIWETYKQSFEFIVKETAKLIYDKKNAGLKLSAESIIKNKKTKKIPFKEDMAEETTKLRLFLTSNLRNQWIHTRRINIYVRKGNHLVNKKITGTLDISNISVNEKYKGRNLAMQFIDDAHKINPFEYTYIENVLNPKLEDKLKDDEWKELSGIFPLCYVKKRRNNGTIDG